MRKILFLVLIFLLVINLLGCSSGMTNEEYSTFETEIQSSMNKVAALIETTLYNSKVLKSDDDKMKVINNHLELASENIVKQVEEVREFIPRSKQTMFTSNYSEIAKDLEDLKWDTSIDKNQYAEKAEVVLNKWGYVLNNNEPITIEAKVEKYMERNNILNTWKDMQYDMPNQLNKEFIVAGKAELNDYYNYGFRDKEKDYFVVRITPYDGEYRNSWYLYFHRESFDELFDSLKEGDRTIIATCEIPDYIYREGQGNMAFVNQVQW